VRALNAGILTLVALSFPGPLGAEGPTKGPSSGPAVTYLASPSAAARNLPFSEAVRVGDLLFLSGQLGVVPGSLALAEGGIQAETRQTLENIKATLERHGSSMRNVVKCTVMLADMKEWPAMNDVYRTFFEKDRLPARSALGASGLALGARVEIECIATVK
jgi:reactive intermediate/imine deaminase